MYLVASIYLSLKNCRPFFYAKNFTEMKKTIFLLAICSLLAAQQSNAQFLKKLKDKAKEAVNKKVDSGSSNDNNSNNNNNNNSNDAGNEGNATQRGKPTNKGGGGLKNTEPPDVAQQMTDAETAYGAAKYSDARYSIQQALMGVEIQLGREILRSLPNPVNELEKDTTQDKVSTAQWGWNNMTIQRIYSDNKDKQLSVSIGNNALYSSWVSLYFNNAYGMQANMENQNMKQTKVKGSKAIIQYSDDKGYTLIVPMGQSSMIVWECINFADENEVMKAANAFDIDSIKKSLGEK